MYYYQLDQLGTPFALLDQHNHLVWQASYSALGQATISVNVIANPLRFQGQYYDEESGLHYNHFRYYDPQTGRFISQDPIDLLGGLNHYQYAPNHINLIDPLGLCAKEDASVGLLDGIVGTADLVTTGLLNTGVDIVAGGAGLVTLAISGGDLDAAVHTIESVQEKQLGLLTQAGEKVANVVAPVVDKYYEQNMAALGKVTLETTGSPALAMMAHKSVEIAGTLLGGQGVLKSLKVKKNITGNLPTTKPTSFDVILAKTEGASPEHVNTRKKVAMDFFENNNFTKNQIYDALGSPDGSKDGGFDLLKPIEIMKFPPPDTMTQYVAPHGYPGNWFDPLSNQTPDSLGISSKGRTLKTFKVVEGTGIKSTAKQVTDTWTTPN
ncbi:RHS repeat-associated core domain-containing protein [Shewanella baltica]|uniref:RHS repeat-associated core domain-containing protein n=1 Tax=Shewanella baltica TaxID=62322 RepID=UPI00287811C5|nr:RHS repeat-associated core domain-containing protein [Shewanella baltica]